MVSAIDPLATSETLDSPDGGEAAIPDAPSRYGLRAPTQARGREKLERMLTAAERVLASRGAEAVTTTTVAAEAGVAVGSVYRYLPHRGAILYALAIRYLDRLSEELDSFAAPAGSGEVEIVEQLVDRFAEFYRTNPGFRALWLSRSLTPDTRAADRAHKRAMADRIMEILVNRGICPADAPAAIATAVHLSADALMQEAFRVDPDGDPLLLREAKRLITSYIHEVATRRRDDDDGEPDPRRSAHAGR